MANTKISQLPLYSGSAADLRWFVMNNSGETETFKFSGFTSQVIPGTGANSLVSNYIPRTHAPSTGEVVLGGTHSTASSGVNSAVVGGTNNRTDNTGGFVGGGESNRAGFRSAVVGGNNNAADGNGSAVIGGGGSTANGTTYGGLFCTVASQVNGGNDESLVIIGGISNAITANGGRGTVIVGGEGNKMFNFDGRGGSDTRNMYGFMCGGKDNRIEGNTTNTLGSHGFPVIIGGKSSKIFGQESDGTETSGATILNSYSSTIKDSLLSAHFECSGSTISGRTQAVMVGTSGRTADNSFTTFVENLQVFRTPSTQVQPVQTGAVFTLDLNNGAKSRFVITGTSTINITNVRDGASFMVQTQTDGNYVNTWTATGGFTFLFEGGIKDPGNSTVDIFKFEVFNNVIYGSRAHNFL